MLLLSEEQVIKHIFKLKVTDRNGLSSDKTIRIIIKHVNPVNHPPIAESQSITKTSGNPIDITLKATDPDDNALTYAITSKPKSGKITEFNKATGSRVYVPDKEFTGQDGFTFKASDGIADSNIALVKITINNNQDTSLGKNITINPKEIIIRQNLTNTNSLFPQGFSEIMNNTRNLFDK